MYILLVKTKIVATKHCPWKSCKIDSRYQHLSNRNKNGDPVHFIRLPSRKEVENVSRKKESAGLLHAVVAILSRVQRTAILAVFILLERMNLH